MQSGRGLNRPGGPRGVFQRVFVLVVLSFVGSPPALADADLSSAAAMIERGEFTMAIARLTALRDKRPNTPEAGEALYYLGRAYEGIGSRVDALEQYAEYLTRVPDGKRESEALQAFRRLHAQEQASAPPSEAELMKLREDFESTGDSVAGRTLADALWRLDRYEDAGAVYGRLLASDPALTTDPVISRRVETDANGSVTVVTPEEMLRRQTAANPIAVHNATSYFGGRDRFTQKPRWYMVTGEVINRGDRVVDGVEVQTTIYAFGNTIYDTDIEHIGRLQPGQSRAFAARFTQFEEINNVSRYEFAVTHD